MLPSRVIRTIPDHFVWCSSEGARPINISMMNSSTTLAFGVGSVWSKIDHDGNYTCNATNAIGTESRTFYVSVIGKIIASVCKIPAEYGKNSKCSFLGNRDLEALRLIQNSIIFFALSVFKLIYCTFFIIT